MTPTFAGLIADGVPEPVHVPIGFERSLPGTLSLPPHPAGVVLFAHGSGSSRLSPRNLFVADRLFGANIGWLLFDLLTEAEAQSRTNVFDIQFLAERLRAATDWVAAYPATRDLPIGYFGASTGAAAALRAAATDERIRAVVSRGGRPDLAGDALRDVWIPTLLIVGGADPTVLKLNAEALAVLGGVKELMVVPRATHLFEEPGALEVVASNATEWFKRYLHEPVRLPTRAGVALGT
jgi:putative phosphoribosyl transferase